MDHVRDVISTTVIINRHDVHRRETEFHSYTQATEVVV